jgi:hypothetical protein
VACHCRSASLFTKSTANHADPLIILKSGFDQPQILRVRFKTPALRGPWARLQKLRCRGTVVPTDIGEDFTIPTQFQKILEILLRLPLGKSVQSRHVGVQAKLYQPIQHLN